MIPHGFYICKFFLLVFSFVKTLYLIQKIYVKAEKNKNCTCSSHFFNCLQLYSTIILFKLMNADATRVMNSNK